MAPRRNLVVGLGKTGVAAARWLRAQGESVTVTDSRSQPPGLAVLGELGASLPLHLGGFDPALLDSTDRVVLSPGVSREEPLIRAALARGIAVLGDIELFARARNAPTVAITGTNGKSTVTTLVAEMARAAGRRVLAGGNLGEPALELLSQPAPELYVLELSSFQLESTESLELLAAAVLNLTPDHLDRYPSLAQYGAAKARIFAHAATAIVNLDDPQVAAMPRRGQRRVGFSLTRADADWGLRTHRGASWLARGSEPLLPLAQLRLPGRHNAANALAALALGEALGLPLHAMLAELETFTGLPHRSQWVAQLKGVTYINDSKGTNVGATLAGVAGLAGPLVLIAGGDGKNQDFAPLAAAFRGKV
ncbi:MAG TPA: UDP-N-acetylmuramoyl-L-alanine--D-glutamate ligase, partial [Steroidobacteraceae bacterium]|nr:UDP-N-acetylmuramoyl-L-alanine--D-glutamate ligase [Steroidobacteraceae bacterium]